jgi:RND family efflux transporter MFP subunit
MKPTCRQTISTAAAALWLLSAATLPAQQPKGQFVPPPPKVIVTAARADTIAEPRTFVGTVRPVRRSIVGSAAAGRVEEYLINDGDAVKAGQPIAQLRRGIVQAELDAAKGQLIVRQAELGWLDKSHQEDIEQAQAKVHHAQAVLAYRQAKLDRSRGLGSAISREVFEDDSSQATQAAANVREADSALRLLTGEAWQMKREQARGWVEAQRAEVARLQEQFDRHTMYAPFDGYVSAEHTEVGQWVMQGDPVAEIVELNVVEVEIPVLEDFIANVHPGLEGRVEIQALAGEQFTGVVAMVNPQADPRARTFPVKLRVQNRLEAEQPVLKAGMLARVTLPIGKPTSTIFVPKDAVVLGGPSPVVYVAQTAGGKTSVRPVNITLGPANGTWIAVTGEIKEADQVVVEGNERLRPAQEVRIETKEIAYP